jgi:hypothetical protein
MTTYWVKYDISITIDPSGPLEPVPPDQTFLGLDLFNNLNAVTITAVPIPSLPFETFFYKDFQDIGVALPPFPIERENVHASISSFFPVGSEPDPTPLLGPSAIFPAAGPFGPVTYATYAWEQITVPNGTVIAPTIPKDRVALVIQDTFDILGAISLGLGTNPVTAELGTVIGEAVLGIQIGQGQIPPTNTGPVSIPPIVNDIFIALGAIGIALSLNPVTAELGLVIGAALLTIQIGVDVVNFIDPFDPNYKTEYVPPPPPIATIQSSAAIPQQLANDVNAVLMSGSNALSYVQALGISSNRFNSAVQAGDQTSAALQSGAINTYLTASSTWLTTFGNNLNTVATDLVASNLDASITAQDVNNFYNSLKTNGFAALLQQVQTDLNNVAGTFNVDPATFDQIAVSKLLAADPTHVPLSIASALQAEANSMKTLAAAYASRSSAASGADNDASEQSVLSLTVNNQLTTPIGAANAASVPFAIAGLDPEDAGAVTFSDGTNQVTVRVSAGQANYTADLTTLADGPISSTLSVNTDPAGNSFMPVAGNTVTLDTDIAFAPVLQVGGGTSNILVNATTAPSVPVTLTGLETGDTGTVTFTDSTGHTVPLAVSASQTSYTVNLSSLADGTITSSLLVTDVANNTTTATGNAVTLDQDKLAEAPILKIGSTSLTVPAGGSIPLGIKVTPVDGDDSVLVTISGVPQGFETITANDGHAPVVQHGANYTFTAADVNAGLTLHSTYRGGGQPVNPFTVTASNTTAGETATSAPQIITVTDPPAASGPPTNPLSLSDLMSQFGSHDATGAPNPLSGGSVGSLTHTVGPTPDIAALTEHFMAAPLVNGGALGLLPSSLATAEEQRSFLAFHHG